MQRFAYIKFVSPRDKLWVYEIGLAGKNNQCYHLENEEDLIFKVIKKNLCG